MLAASRRDIPAIYLALVAFVGVGSVAVLLGLAWPSIRQTFDLQQDDIGTLLIAQTVGYMSSSFFNGRLMVRLGTRRSLRLGAGIIGLGMIGIAAAPSWPLVIGSAMVTSFGSGIMDAGLNNYVASYYGARQMNWLHASFGVGQVLGSWVMTRILADALPWRIGYALAAGVELALVVMFILTANSWHDGLPQRGLNEDDGHASMRETLRLPMLWMGIFVVFLIAGLEVSRSTWMYSILTGPRGLDTTSAGTWVTISLASFTFGRVFFGFVGDRYRPSSLLRACMAGAIVGALLLWWNPTPALGFLGLVVLCFGQAPMFPLFLLGTSERVGPRHSAAAVGMQLSGAGAGLALIPAIGGVIAQHVGLAGVLPFLAVLAVLVFGAYEATLLGVARTRMAEAVPAHGK